MTRTPTPAGRRLWARAARTAMPRLLARPRAAAWAAAWMLVVAVPTWIGVVPHWAGHR